MKNINQKKLLILAIVGFIISFGLMGYFLIKPEPTVPPGDRIKFVGADETQTMELPSDMLTQNKSKTTSLLIFGGFVFLILIGGFVAYKLTNKRRHTQFSSGIPTKVDSRMLGRDKTRKDDIGKIRQMLAVFYQNQTRYPSDEEFKTTFNNIPLDPLNGMETGFPDVTFRYHYQASYDNSAVSGAPQSYLVWCVLENKADPQVKNYLGVYSKTAEDVLS